MVDGEHVYFIGESHVLRFGNRVVERGAASPLVCRPVFLSGALSLATIANGETQLAPRLRRGMRASRLLVDPREIGEVVFGPEDEAGFAAHRLGYGSFSSRASEPPLLVFCLGSYDVFLTITQFPALDFVMPPTQHLHALAPQFAGDLADAAGVDEATAWFTGRVKPMQNAFRRLRTLGFTRLAFLSIAPPTLDDEVCRKVCAQLGVDRADAARMRAAFRYKAALFLNALVAQACDVEGAAFLDAWPMLTEDGIARPGIFQDGAHLTDEAVDAILLELVVPAAER